jgi:predicted metalloenzyme YecM
MALTGPEGASGQSLPAAAVVEAAIGDYQCFFEEILSRLARIGIDVESYPVSHVAFRVESIAEYFACRDRLETVSIANVENVWSGRPISKILLRTPLTLGVNHAVGLIELIPPPHRPGYPMGLEHVGFTLGDQFDAFADRYDASITAHQDQGPHNQPLLITFENGRSAKFHRRGLYDVIVMEGNHFDGFHHVVESKGGVARLPSE